MRFLDARSPDLGSRPEKLCTGSETKTDVCILPSKIPSSEVQYLSWIRGKESKKYPTTVTASANM